MSVKTHKRRCTAKLARTKKPCKKAPINGGTVCDRHGGRAPQVKNKAKERIRQYVADMVDPDRALQEAARLAYGDITELYDGEGKLLPMSKWPDSIKGSVKSAETIRGNLDDTDGKSDKVVRVVLKDAKVKALEMLFKHLGLAEERLRIDGDITYRWAGE